VDPDVTTLQQQFGNLIRSRRKAAGLGQEALADKATLHRTHVSLLERGKRMPSLLVVKKLAAALDTTMASLMEELERPPAGLPGGKEGAARRKGSPPASKKRPAKSPGRRTSSRQS
jgi:transcriptional regulator with XRE-family HTH domain